MAHHDVKAHPKKDEPTPPAGAADAPPITLTAEEYAKLEQAAQEAATYKDQLQRLAAEFDNAKKRMVREKDDHAKWSTESLILQLLPIIDSFDAALQSLKNHDAKDPVVTGVKLINRQLHELLTREGVERLQTLGTPFDPERHEAIQQIDSHDQPENSVVEEIQAGYVLRGRLIRPALVKIAKKPSEPDAQTSHEQD